MTTVSLVELVRSPGSDNDQGIITKTGNIPVVMDIKVTHTHAHIDTNNYNNTTKIGYFHKRGILLKMYTLNIFQVNY